MVGRLVRRRHPARHRGDRLPRRRDRPDHRVALAAHAASTRRGIGQAGLGRHRLYAASRRAGPLDPHIKARLRPGRRRPASLDRETTSQWFADRGPGDAASTQIRVPTLFVAGHRRHALHARRGDHELQDPARATACRPKMLWFCGGHGACLTDPGDPARVERASLAWLDRYVKGDASVDTGPRFDWIDQRRQALHRAATSPSRPARRCAPRAAGGCRSRPAAARARVGARPDADVVGQIAADITPARADDARRRRRSARGAPRRCVGAPTAHPHLLAARARGDRARPSACSPSSSTTRPALVLGNQVTPIPVTLDGQTHTVTAPARDRRRTRSPRGDASRSSSSPRPSPTRAAARRADHVRARADRAAHPALTRRARLPRPMRLLPREQDRLLLFLAAELARKRRGRGLRLNQAEAAALIADEVCEAARDGRSYARGRGRRLPALGAGRRARRRRRTLVRRVEVEALFADGSRLLVLHDPISARPGRPPHDEPGVPSGSRATPRRCTSSTRARCRSASRRTSTSSRRTARCASTARRPGACGSRSRPARRSCFDPGMPRKVQLVPFGGARVIRGHAGLVRRPARRARRARRGARARPRAGVPRCLSRRDPRSATPTSGSSPRPTRPAGPTGSSPASATRCATGSACAPSAAGSSWRSSAAWSPTRCSACATTSLGIAGGRIVGVGRAGNPDTMDGIDVVLDTGTVGGRRRRGMIVTPGGVDPHVHWLSPQVDGRRARRRADDARDPGLRPGLEPRQQPGGGARRRRGRRSRPTRSTPRCSCARRPPGRPRSRHALRAGGGGPEDPRGRQRRARADPHARSTSPTATTCSSRSTRTGSTRRCRCSTRSTRSAAARSTPSTSRAAAAGTRRTCSRWPAASGC